MYLLDTCVFSEFSKLSPSPKVLEWSRGVRESNQYLSVLVLGELLHGVARLPESGRKTKLGLWIEGLFDSHRDRLVPVDTEVMRIWSVMCAEAESAGHGPKAMDSLIGAQCKSRGLTLVTRNTADFSSLGVELLDPWR